MGSLLDRLRCVQDVEVEGKRVVVRVDYNVPLVDGRVGDDARIRASLPTLENILDRGGKPILLTHLGRPEGKVVPELRLDAVAERLQELLGRLVRKLDTCIGDDVVRARASSLRSAICSSTMPLLPCTARTPPRWGSLTTFPPTPAYSCRRR